MLPPWHPESFKKRHQNLKTRQKIIRACRAWFEENDFTEVETPALQISPGNEVHLQAFQTTLKDPHNDAPKNLYLHTSPEFAMKKLLVAGLEKIVQITPVYRNSERSRLHHPAFTMIEWYRASESLDAIAEDCVNLVRAVAKALSPRLSAVALAKADGGELGGGIFTPWEYLSVQDAFLRYANIDLLSTATDPALLRAAMAHLKLHTAEDDSWEDLFFRIMGAKIEPFLGQDRPTFLCDYPISMAALARANETDPRLAKRFELYIKGYEIANAFDELTDADEQQKRFEADMELKQRLYGESFPIDEDFINALHYLPPCAGIALGLDRLIMLCTGAEHIEDVLWLPVA
ncbi:MAG: EF-P lysine aminoacylase EpmA [Alphaproteobacteria bacterium]|nr:EF-P lysine aminoacylase EpmA [Alphaproteobacteria bacterium]